jgi:hypothetical protein
MKLLGGVGVILALASPAAAQVPCVRLDATFSCADGTSLAIYDDPWRGFRGRGGAGWTGESGMGRGGEWSKDDRYVHGPRGELCLLHGNHVHCDGTFSDRP